MIAAFFIFNSKGEVLISRLFREGVKRNVSEVFRIQVISNPDIRSPILTLGSTTFLHKKLNSLWIVCVTRSNADASVVFEFLSQFVDLVSGLLAGDISINNNNNSNSASVSRRGSDVNPVSTLSSSRGKRDLIAEEDVKNNFTLIYELLDEMIQFGYPQTTDIEIIKLNLTSSIKLSSSSSASSSSSSLANINGASSSSLSIDGSSKNIFKKTLTRTGTLIRKSNAKTITPNKTNKDSSHLYSNTPWRQPNIRYRKNEVFVDVIEEISLLMSPNGDIIRSFVDGKIKINSKLSGMPMCSFGMATENANTVDPDSTFDELTENEALTNCTFHQCVSLKDYDEEKLIKFIPPDGEFELMTYRINIGFDNLPFLVKVKAIPLGHSRVEFKVSLISNTTDKSMNYKDLKIKIPAPPNTIDFQIVENQSNSKPKFSTDENMIIWNLKKLQGGFNNKVSLICICETASNTDNNRRWTKPPVSIIFSIDKHSASGQLVKYLKVEEESNYSTVKWVTYQTNTKSFEIRY